MKLLTLNCHSWQEENQEEKMDIIVDTIIKNRYDVIALQEVSQLISSKVIYSDIKEDNFCYLINQKLRSKGCFDYQFYWDISHIGYDIYEEGLAILTKHKIKDTEGFIVSSETDISNFRTRKIVKMTVDYEGQEIDFLSCHLGWFEDLDFGIQIDNLFKESDRLTFYLGDFNNNAFLEKMGYSKILEKGVFDTYNLAKIKDSGITVFGKIDGWEKNKNSLRLDLILSNKEVDVKYSKVIFNGVNEKIVSDHFGVEIEI